MTKQDLILIGMIGLALAVSATLWGIYHEVLITYGDAESHLNIAKRVTHSVTPGLAQLGGIWLPLPHLLMVPFTAFDSLWQTGLAGAIVSGLTYILSIIFIYAIAYELTANRPAAYIAAAVLALNPNVLYLQMTAMTEVPLLAFFTGSIYFFIKYLRNHSLIHLILAAALGLAATLSRYDGWFLVITQLGVLIVIHLIPVVKKGHHSLSAFKQALFRSLPKIEAHALLFATMAFIGIGLWILWDFLILNDPLYFTNSPFSAKSQQQEWFSRGELPAYGNLSLSFIYYAVTSVANIGTLLSLTALLGGIVFFFYKPSMIKSALAVLLFVPVIFYTVTLYMGQSIIFIPQLTPATYEWNLFNVRYGVMMIPAAAVFIGYGLFVLARLIRGRAQPLWATAGTLGVVGLILLQQVRFFSRAEPVISFDDGLYGLSASRSTDAEAWIRDHYDGGYILVDDFARTLSIIRSGLPMEKVIYIGNKPYWEETLQAPEKYVRWLIMQDGDAVWQTLYEDDTMRGRVYAHFEKTYTSPKILIFKQTTPPTLALEP
jgi:hypothetical protein